jgi:hypothetical protein
MTREQAIEILEANFPDLPQSEYKNLTPRDFFVITDNQDGTFEISHIFGGLGDDEFTPLRVEANETHYWSEERKTYLVKQKYELYTEPTGDVDLGGTSIDTIDVPADLEPALFSDVINIEDLNGQGAVFSRKDGFGGELILDNTKRWELVDEELFIYQKYELEEVDSGRVDSAGGIITEVNVPYDLRPADFADAVLITLDNDGFTVFTRVDGFGPSIQVSPRYGYREGPDNNIELYNKYELVLTELGPDEFTVDIPADMQDNGLSFPEAITITENGNTTIIKRSDDFGPAIEIDNTVFTVAVVDDMLQIRRKEVLSLENGEIILPFDLENQKLEDVIDITVNQDGSTTICRKDGFGTCIQVGAEYDVNYADGKFTLVEKEDIIYRYSGNLDDSGNEIWEIILPSDRSKVELIEDGNITTIKRVDNYGTAVQVDTSLFTLVETEQGYDVYEVAENLLDVPHEFGGVIGVIIEIPSDLAALDPDATAEDVFDLVVDENGTTVKRKDGKGDEFNCDCNFELLDGELFVYPDDESLADLEEDDPNFPNEEVKRVRKSNRQKVKEAQDPNYEAAWDVDENTGEIYDSAEPTVRFQLPNDRIAIRTKANEVKTLPSSGTQLGQAPAPNVQLPQQITESYGLPLIDRVYDPSQPFNAVYNPEVPTAQQTTPRANREIRRADGTIVKNYTQNTVTEFVDNKLVIKDTQGNVLDEFTPEDLGQPAGTDIKLCYHEVINNILYVYKNGELAWTLDLTDKSYFISDAGIYIFPKQPLVLEDLTNGNQRVRVPVDLISVGILSGTPASVANSLTLEEFDISRNDGFGPTITRGSGTEIQSTAGTEIIILPAIEDSYDFSGIQLDSNGLFLERWTGSSGNDWLGTDALSSTVQTDIIRMGRLTPPGSLAGSARTLTFNIIKFRLFKNQWFLHFRTQLGTFEFYWEFAAIKGNYVGHLVTPTGRNFIVDDFNPVGWSDFWTLSVSLDSVGNKLEYLDGVEIGLSPKLTEITSNKRNYNTSLSILAEPSWNNTGVNAFKFSTQRPTPAELATLHSEI